MSKAVTTNAFLRYCKALLSSPKEKRTSSSAFLHWAASARVTGLGFELLNHPDWRKPLTVLVSELPQFFLIEQVHVTLHAPDLSDVPIVLASPAEGGAAHFSSSSQRHQFGRKNTSGLSLEVEIQTDETNQSEPLALMSDRLFEILERAYLERQRIVAEIRRNHESMTQELHDSVAQQLGYLSLTAATLEKRHVAGNVQNQSQRIREIRSGLEQVQRQVREIIAGVRLSLDAPSLSQALEASMREYGRRSSILFELDNRVADSILSQEVAMQILQIAREAMANIVRHSHAQFASVSLLSFEDHVEVTIKDNGKGFSQQTDEDDHYGLMIMQERARTIGATLEIASKLGKGTTLTVKLPMGIQK
ncbi:MULTISPECIES: sensor histidine kinase [Pseudomonas]|uniref:sensor histidine kinase n=1 Tax=Pseudomonas TaxID=286 RepID=UPI001EE8303F|nr:ATP-binding protein [Pseudomonas putida]